MNITRYDPWQSMEQWRREMDRLFGMTPAEEGASHVERGDWTPAVDIKETDNAYVLEADIPGVDPKDIEVTMENGVLTVRGERKYEKEEEKENYKRVERARGVFLRRFTLPENADPEAITAKGNHGVLEITIPKTQAHQPRRIAVEQ